MRLEIYDANNNSNRAEGFIEKNNSNSNMNHDDKNVSLVLCDISYVCSYRHYSSFRKMILDTPLRSTIAFVIEKEKRAKTL